MAEKQYWTVGLPDRLFSVNMTKKMLDSGLSSVKMQSWRWVWIVPAFGGEELSWVRGEGDRHIWLCS
jgi:hypothetical protein